ncbi:MAG: hypothetical protein ACM31C_16115 [Acidobacteriota bacterium]
MQREDYVMRLIAQLAEAVRRITGRRREGDSAGSLDEARRAWDDVLGVPRELVEVTDTATLAGLLREPMKWRAAAELLAEEARTLAGHGDPVHASVLYRRALELALEARAADPQPGDDATILELSRFVSAHQLAPQYRS